MNRLSKMDKKNFTAAQKIAKETTISFVGMVYGQFIRYMFTVVMTRLVGVGYLGLYSLGFSITTIATVIGKVGMDVGLMRFISRKNLKEDTIRIKSDIYSTLKIGIIISIVVMIIQIIVSKWLVEDFFHESSLLRTILIVNAIAIPLVTITTISIHATQGFQLLKYKIFVEYILNPTLLLVSVIFVYLLFSAELAIMVPYLFAGIITSIMASIFLNKVSGVNVTKLFKADCNNEILMFSLPIMFTVILGTMLHWMDVIMIGYFADSETVGLYHPIVRTAGIQNSILIAFSGIFTPMFSKYYAVDEKQKMEHIYRLVTRWILTFIVPIFIFILLFSKKIMLLFGAEFLGVSHILIVLSVGTSVFAVLGISSSALVVSGYQKLNFINAFVATVLNITLNIILIPRYGILGAAWATLIALSLIAILRVIEARILLSINPFYLKDLKSIIAGLITFSIVFYVKPYLMHFHTVVTLILAVVTIAVAYGIVMFIFVFDEDDKDFLSSLNFLKNEVLKARK